MTEDTQEVDVGVVSEDDLVAINIRTVPRDLRIEFKQLCTRHQVSMHEVILDLIQRCVDGKISVVDG